MAMQGYRVTAAVVGSNTLSGVTDASVSYQGNAQDISHDGSSTIQGTVVDGIACELKITCQDLKTLDSYKRGDVPTTASATFKNRASGTGDGTGTATMTLTNPVVVDIEHHASTSGVGAATITLRAPTGTWS